MKIKNKLILGVLAGLGVSTLTSQAAVIVTFSQVGADVVGAWSGSIDAGTWFNDASLFSDFAYGWTDTLINGVALADFEYFNSGTVSGTSLMSTGPSASSFNGGFYKEGFYGIVDALDDDMAPTSSIYYFLGSTHYMTWSDTTLAEIGADAFDNTLAWTSSAGGTNTISYTTVVPEPSSAALLALGGGGLMVRRRR